MRRYPVGLGAQAALNPAGIDPRYFFDFQAHKDSNKPVREYGLRRSKHVNLHDVLRCISLIEESG